jgi:hypothetical protein
MKTRLAVLLTVLLAVCAVIGMGTHRAGAELGFRNGNMSAITGHMDTLYVNGGLFIGAGTGITSGAISDSIASAGEAHDFATHEDVSDSLAALELSITAGISDSLDTAAETRGFMLKAALADSLTGRIGTAELEADAVDSTKVKPASISVSDIANGDNGFLLKTALRNPTTWCVPLPVIPDTVKSSLDSLTVLHLADAANLPYDYATHLHAFGNGSAAVDSVFLCALFEPRADNPDSLYFWVKASTTSADSASVVVKVEQKGAGTDTPFTSENLGVAAKNTWERKAYAYDDFLAGPYVLTVRFRLRMSQTFTISPVWFK